MGMRYEDEVTAQLIAAEQEGMWLITRDRLVRQTLRRRVVTGELLEPFHGCFARRAIWDQMKALPRYWYVLRAVAKAYPGCVFCRESAAVLHGLSVSYRALSSIHIATSRHAHSSSSKLLMRHVIEGDTPVVIQGMHATSLARTAFDCMRAEPFPQALAVADSALRTGRIDRDSLRAYAESKHQSPGIGVIRRALDYADPRAENGGESIARATMIELGYVIPDLQVPFTDKITGAEYRVDFVWYFSDKKPIAGELDGKLKYEDPAFMGGRDVVGVLTDERRRESRLTIDVSAVCRFSLQEVYDRHPFAQILDAFGIPRTVGSVGG